MKDIYSKFSILLNIIFSMIILKINFNISQKYLSSNGKTKAIFSLVEMSYFYQYYFLILIIFAIIATIVAKRKMENETLALSSLILSIISVLLIFVGVWRIMIL